MTTSELCRSIPGLTRGKLGALIESGLIESAGPAGTGHRREFSPDQVERARLIVELKRRGVALAKLAGRSLAFPETERFVVFDGQRLRACRDAEAAIGMVVRAGRRCSAIDLAAIRNPAE